MRAHSAIVAIAAALSLGVAGGYAVTGYMADESPEAITPTSESADAGFARDMRVHHIQAVDLAHRIGIASDEAPIDGLAFDIESTQTAQIGIMQGWLEAWALPLNDERPAMAWMGHPVDGLMPGIATQDEVRSISTLPVVEAEIRFLQLMISHHEGGVQMAKAALELAETPPVRRLAEKIIAAQATEIAVMTALLAERGAAPPDPLPDHDT